MDSRLQRLVDEDDIRRLVMVWMDGIDTRDTAKICSAWAAEQESEFDGFPDMGAGPIRPGRWRTAERAANLVRMLSHFSVTQHVSSNHIVTVDGDHATCSCYVLATHHMPIDRGEPWSTIGARYDLKAQRFEEGWRLTHLKWARLWTSGNDGLWAEIGRRLAAG